ncbi:uncharacterized protein LOC108110367 [Drosophila eugracilis]|uniref:uncharacterized protein LOC108110367 n=1 Tax=Drosophila eugracilis TaxID=29029 RepID=UPI0007E73179|nr:uncharacterized protein LOC108110367 [Drosophila eugracilis]
MPKRVSIVLPEEMPADSLGSSKNLKPTHTVKSSIRNASTVGTELAPPIFVVVSPHSSQISITSSQWNTSVTSDSSQNNAPETDSKIQAVTTLESSALAQSGSSNSQESASFGTTTNSIKQFLRTTVALVRAGESFTSVKRLFHNFIKNSGSISNSKPSLVTEDSTSQGTGTENPYLSKSNDTLLTDWSLQLTVPSTSKMTPTAPHSNFAINNANYDLTSLLSDITPLTGYTIRSDVASTEEAGDRTDTSAYTAPNNVRYEFDSSSELPLGNVLHGGLSKWGRPNTLKFKIAKPSGSRSVSKNRSSSRSLRLKFNASTARTPNVTPRIDHTAYPIEPKLALVISTGPSSERSSGSRRSRRRSQGPSLNLTAKNSASSSSRAELVNLKISSGEQSPKSFQSRNSSKRTSPRSSRRSFRSRSRTSASENLKGAYQQKGERAPEVEYAFTIVSPEEADNSHPEENTGGDVEDASSNCRTYQEDCKCHHCQDMRRAVKRAEFFQSPEGKKRLEAKLLAKNFFMDICALSEVRHQIQDDLKGTRKHPSARVSYPVSICGATRLDGGSLSVQWFTHDLDNVDHFDIFVDNVPSRSVYNRLATNTVLIDVNASKTHTLRMRAVPTRGTSGRDSSVDKFMSEVAAGHMRQVMKGQLFARCFEHLDARPQQQTLVDFWTDSEFLYMPACDTLKITKGR